MKNRAAEILSDWRLGRYEPRESLDRPHTPEAVLLAEALLEAWDVASDLLGELDNPGTAKHYAGRLAGVAA